MQHSFFASQDFCNIFPFEKIQFCIFKMNLCYKSYFVCVTSLNLVFMRGLGILLFLAMLVT